MNVPVVFHASEELLPDRETFSQLENLAKDKRLFHHVAAMSDVHPKKGRKNPTGTVVVSKKHLLPQINDTAPNCGMRFLCTDMDDTNTTPEQIDELFKELVKAVPTKKYVGTKIPYDISFGISKEGTRPLAEYLKTRTKNEIRNTFSGGNFFRDKEVTGRDIRDAIPDLFIRLGKYRLGILGAAGNHFLDLMKVTDIGNGDIAAEFGVRKGQYIFLIHTGSSIVGQYASYMYTPKIKEHFSQKMMLKIGTTFFDSQMRRVYGNIWRKIRENQGRDEFFGYNDESLEGRMFLTAHQASGNFGFANRLVIGHNLDQALEKTMKRKVELDLLYDTPHIFINREKHFGEDVWVHRNGTVSARGPQGMAGHPVFEKTGEPVFIPSSMSTPAYLCAGTDRNESSFFSASHGTGKRRLAQEEAAGTKNELMEHMEKKHVRLYNAKSKGIVHQDSGYYKDVEKVIEGMVDNGTVNVVAKMMPVAVLMY